ncbi:MAG: sigma-70 family RNA polymerase sigma factor [Ruminococcus sp.]|nr:sigma-70 family RNA polymerase sigma factor [Ruminococcus sp.]
MTHSEYRRLLKEDVSGAQRAVFDEYFNYVYVIVYNRLQGCGRREDVDECVSDVFVDAFSSYDPDMLITGDIKGFLGMVADRRATDYYRRLSRSPVPVSIDDENAEQLPASDDVQTNTENSEIRRILLELVDSLGEPDATIIIQKYFYKRSSKEISKIVPLAPVSIRLRSIKALKKLKKMLTDRNITV